MTEPVMNTVGDEEVNPSLPRRKFLMRLSGLVGWTSIGAWLTGLSLASVRFFFPRVRYEPPTRFKIGLPEDYVVDTIDSRWIKEHNVFIVRQPKGIYVMKSICPHLGCAVSWFNSESIFKCPCHGSFFDVNGDVIGGPAPGPLARVGVSLDLAGNIVVDTVQEAGKTDQREKRAFLLKV